MAIILGFDVSQGLCSVAISNGFEILSSIKLREPSQQAEMLIPVIEETLKNAKLEYNDINYISTTTGPGSFTGIRIGLAAAAGLLISLKATPVAITNFDTICYRTLEQIKNADYIVAIVNAYRQECYFQIFNREGEAITLPDMCNNSEILEIIAKLPGKVWCAGSGLVNIIAHLNSRGCNYLPRFSVPDARTICRTAYKQIKSEIYSSELNPLYIRKPDAKLPSKLL
jgi:tRNA threonylcarbamoyladenosine biosynthesis protein TsaB